MTSRPVPDDAEIEMMAKAIHANYLGGTSLEEHPAMRPWDDLSEELRDQNRDQARDNIAKLASIGMRVERGHTEEQVAALSDDQVERLAREEHDRWAGSKRAHGYRYGPERVDEGTDRRHPDLREWAELPEPVREKDRAPVRRMIAVLAAANLTVRAAESGPGDS